MGSVRHAKIFNKSDCFVEGWYWALRSSELPIGSVKPVNLLGRELAVYRGEDGGVVAVDAYCPHMGAHLAEGKVDGTGIRCFFHNWKFESNGECVDVPCLGAPAKAQLRTWPTAERYGLIWIWTGPEAQRPVPFAPELEGDECEWAHGARFIKNCHPNVVMINAIDEHHFNTVHHLPVDLYMKSESLNQNVIKFSNTTRLPDTNPIHRFVNKFYEGALTYSMAYWFGQTGTVTVGPDFQHFHIMFALRLLADGRTEGQTILLTKKRAGVAGKVWSRISLQLSKVVGNYFAGGDTRVFQTMKYDFQTPTKADHAIIDFIKHVDQQRALRWGTWEPAQDDRVSLQVVA